MTPPIPPSSNNGAREERRPSFSQPTPLVPCEFSSFIEASSTATPLPPQAIARPRISTNSLMAKLATILINSMPELYVLHNWSMYPVINDLVKALPPVAEGVPPVVPKRKPREKGEKPALKEEEEFDPVKPLNCNIIKFKHGKSLSRFRSKFHEHVRRYAQTLAFITISFIQGLDRYYKQPVAALGGEGKDNEGNTLELSPPPPTPLSRILIDDSNAPEYQKDICNFHAQALSLHYWLTEIIEKFHDHNSFPEEDESQILMLKTEVENLVFIIESSVLRRSKCAAFAIIFRLGPDAWSHSAPVFESMKV